MASETAQELSQQWNLYTMIPITGDPHHMVCVRALGVSGTPHTPVRVTLNQVKLKKQDQGRDKVIVVEPSLVVWTPEEFEQQSIADGGLIFTNGVFIQPADVRNVWRAVCILRPAPF